MFNHKDARIRKLAAKGMTPEQIATKIGFGKPPTEAGVERVRETLRKEK